MYVYAQSPCKNVCIPSELDGSFDRLPNLPKTQISLHCSLAVGLRVNSPAPNTCCRFGWTDWYAFSHRIRCQVNTRSPNVCGISQTTAQELCMRHNTPAAINIKSSSVSIVRAGTVTSVAFWFVFIVTVRTVYANVRVKTTPARVLFTRWRMQRNFVVGELCWWFGGRARQPLPCSVCWYVLLCVFAEFGEQVKVINVAFGCLAMLRVGLGCIVFCFVDSHTHTHNSRTKRSMHRHVGTPTISDTYSNYNYSLIIEFVRAPRDAFRLGDWDARRVDDGTIMQCTELDAAVVCARALQM